jgi:hypothetical protein
MKILIASALFLCSTASFSQPLYQLAPPLMKFGSVFFSKKVLVDLQFRFTGSQIRYTLDGRVPTDADFLYRRPVNIRNGFTTLTARVYSQGYLPSETVSATFIPDGINVKEAGFPAASSKFPGSGPATLIDNKGGNASIGSATWLGYEEDSIALVITLKKTGMIKQVLLDLLEDHGSWIFLPEKIEVYYIDADSGEQRDFGRLLIPAEEVILGSRCAYRIIEPVQPVMTNKLIIRLTALKSMPESHPGKGKKSWIFIDEIKVY